MQAKANCGTEAHIRIMNWKRSEEMNISSLACHALSEINLHWAVAWYFYISFSHPFLKQAWITSKTQSAQMGFGAVLGSLYFPFPRLPSENMSLEVSHSVFPLPAQRIFMFLVTAELQPLQSGQNKTQSCVSLLSPPQGLPPPGFCLCFFFPLPPWNSTKNFPALRSPCRHRGNDP